MEGSLGIFEVVWRDCKKPRIYLSVFFSVEVGDDVSDVVENTCVCSAFLWASPELILSSPTRNDCEFFPVDSDEDPCASPVSVVSCLVLASSDTELCLEELCVCLQGQRRVTLFEKHGMCFPAHSAQRSPVKRQPFLGRFCERRTQSTAQHSSWLMARMAKLGCQQQFVETTKWENKRWHEVFFL